MPAPNARWRLAFGAVETQRVRVVEHRRIVVGGAEHGEHGLAREHVDVLAAEHPRSSTGTIATRTVCCTGPS